MIIRQMPPGTRGFLAGVGGEEKVRKMGSGGEADWHVQSQLKKEAVAPQRRWSDRSKSHMTALSDRPA